MTRPAGEARRIWTAPALIGAATLVGLIGALLTEEALWDGSAALLLLAVLAYATGLGLRPGERPRDRGRGSKTDR